MMEIDYEGLCGELLTVIPDTWESVILYAEYTPASYSFKYFVKTDGKYVDCYDLEGVNEDLLIQKFMTFDKIIRPSRLGLSGKDKWTVMTLTIRNDGEFNAEFDYTDISENSIEYFQEWKKKYLK